MVSYAVALLPFLSLANAGDTMQISRVIPIGTPVTETDGTVTTTVQDLECSGLISDVADMDGFEAAYGNHVHVFGRCYAPPSQSATSSTSARNCGNMQGISAMCHSTSSPSLYVKCAIDEDDGCSTTSIEQTVNWCKATTVTHDDKCQEFQTERLLWEKAVEAGEDEVPTEEDPVDVLRGSRRLAMPINTQSPYTSMSPSKPVIDVGFAITKDVLCKHNEGVRDHSCDHNNQAYLDSICAKVKLALDEANEVLDRSMIDTAFRMVDCDLARNNNNAFLPDNMFDGTSSQNGCLGGLLNNFKDMHSNHITNTENTHGADIQVMVAVNQQSNGQCVSTVQNGMSFIEGTSVPTNPTHCNPYGPTTPERALAVVPLRSLDDNDFVLAHELMHILGAIDNHAGVCYDTMKKRTVGLSEVAYMTTMCGIMNLGGSKPNARRVGILSGATLPKGDLPNVYGHGMPGTSVSDFECDVAGCQMWGSTNPYHNHAYCIKSNWDTVASYVAEITTACLDTADCDPGQVCMDLTCEDDCAGDDANCSDGNPCTTGSCNGDGTCSYTAEAGCCNADNECPNNHLDMCDTSHEVCIEGSCVSAPLTCSPPFSCSGSACVCSEECCDDNDCPGAQTCNGNNQCDCASSSPDCCVDNSSCSGNTDVCGLTGQAHGGTCNSGTKTCYEAAPNCGSNSACSHVLGCCHTKKGAICDDTGVNADPCCPGLTCRTSRRGISKCQF